MKGDAGCFAEGLATHYSKCQTTVHKSVIAFCSKFAKLIRFETRDGAGVLERMSMLGTWVVRCKLNTFLFHIAFWRGSDCRAVDPAAGFSVHLHQIMDP